VLAVPRSMPRSRLKIPKSFDRGRNNQVLLYADGPRLT
jgi:hypothetical protein